MSVSLPVQVSFTCKAHAHLFNPACDICKTLKEFDVERVRIIRSQERLAKQVADLTAGGKVIAHRIVAAHEI